MSDRGPRRLGRLGSVLLTTGAVVGGLCIVGLLVCLVLGLRPMVVTSGSMSPTIPAGSLAFAEGAPASDVEVGDIVVVPRTTGGRVMHRVVNVVPAGEEVVLTLQGDANATPDRTPYVVRTVHEERFHVPLLGYPVTWLSTPVGLIGLGAAACLLLLFAFRRTERPAGRRRAVAAVVAPATALAAVSVGPPASAYFSDSGDVTSGTTAALTVTAPASASCSASLLTATVSWPGDVRYDYQVVLRRVSNSSVVSTTQVTGTGNSVTYSGLTSFGLVAGAGTVDFQVEITSYLVNATGWKSATARTYQYVRVFALVVGASVSCTT